MTPRLPWKRNPAGGFIAFPEGESFRTRFAALRRDQTSAIPWQWWICYDDAKRADHAATRQAAADAATAAWPAMKAEAARLAALAAEAEALRTLVQRMMSEGDLPLSLFEIPTAESSKLLRIIDLARSNATGGPAQPLVAACSAELFRRRSERGAPAKG